MSHNYNKKQKTTPKTNALEFVGKKIQQTTDSNNESTENCRKENDNHKLLFKEYMQHYTAFHESQFKTLINELEENAGGLTHQMHFRTMRFSFLRLLQ